MSQSPTEIAAVKHSYATLDGLRGIAAAAVVVWHSQILFGSGIVAASAYLAVDLFFLMSGFVIAHAYDPRFTAGLDTATFMRLRIIRLYPLYFLGLVVMVLAVLAASTIGMKAQWTGSLLSLSTFLSLFFLPSPPFAVDALFPLNGPAWSLFFEIIVNAFLVTARSWLGPRNLVMLIGVSLFFLVVSAVQFGSLNTGSNWSNFWAGFPRVFYSFFLGVLLYRHRNSLPAFNWAHPLALLFLVLGFLSINPGSWRMEYDLICVTVIFPMIIALATSVEPRGGWRKPFIFLGTVSYALYVLHVPFLSIVKGVLKTETGNMLLQTVPLLGFIFLGGMIVICAFLDRYYDLPVRKWLNRRSWDSALKQR